MSDPSKFVSNVTRRTWDLSKYESSAREQAELAAAREQEASACAVFRNHSLAVAEKGTDSKALTVRAPLKKREVQLDLYSKVGKFNVITQNTPLSERGGFYCESCDCLLKDSNSYLDHINGKKHQRTLGMTMRTERANVEQVRQQFQQHKKRKAEQQDISGAQSRLAKFEEEAEAAKREKRRKRELEKAKEAGEGDEDEEEDNDGDRRMDDAELNSTAKSKTAGSSSSSSSASVKQEPDLVDSNSASATSSSAASSSSANGANVTVKKEENKPEIDPMMAAMGFNFSFGGSKKNS